MEGIVRYLPEDPADQQPTLALIFNDRSGATHVREIIEREHAFCRYEVLETQDEEGRGAWVLAVWCETADSEVLFGMIGTRLPDYIRARRFPPSRVPPLLA